MERTQRGTAWLRFLAAVLSLSCGWGVASVARAGPPDQEQPELVQPVVTNEVSITYPESLLELDEPPGGTVIIRYVVGVDGVPKELEVLEAVHPELDRIALDAVGALRFEPATYGGQTVEVMLSIGITIEPPEVEAPPQDPVDPDDVDEPDGWGEPGGAGGSEETGDAGEQGLGPERFRGVLLEAGDRTPLEGATILVVPPPEDLDLPVGQIRKTIYEPEVQPEWTYRAVTDAEGRFAIRGVPVGKVRVIVLNQGYRRVEFIEDLSEAGEILEVEYFAVRMSDNPYRTVVDTERDLPDVTRRSITAEEINNLPGTQGDALKAIQNFPGVARAPFGAGLLIVRGAAPSDSRTYLGYHEIPQLFHFGALTSVFNSDILAQIDFIPGNFDARFGDAIGGIINVQPRKGRRDGYHGYVDADLFDASLLLEGPVGKGSFALSGRRSYIDALLPAFLPDDVGLDFNVAPRYYDYQGMFDYPIGDGNFTVRAFGSDDRLALIAPSPNEEASDDDSFGTAITFHRFDLVYRRDKGRWSFLITPSYRWDRITASGGDLFEFSVLQNSFSFRSELGYRVSRNAAFRIGTESSAGAWRVTATSPAFPQPGAGSQGLRQGLDLDRWFVQPAVFATATLGIGERLTLFPGVRFSQYYGVMRELAVDPRIRAVVDITDNTSIKAGFGKYSQLPDINEFFPLFGNPALQVEQSLHTSVGVAHNFPQWDFNIEVTGFHKYLWDIVGFSPNIVVENDGSVRPENFWNNLTGQIGGVEVLVRKELTNNFFGWVSYTFNRSFYQFPDRDTLTPTDFDQPHILTIIGVYKLPFGWQLGGRFRLVSGFPDDPIATGILDSDGNYIDIVGEDNSDRLPAFHQLDVRLDKTFTFKRWMLNLYVDVQNVYNRRNTETFNYSYNFQERTPQPGLPIIPSLGFRGSF